jgi:elongation factor P--(R)-beta-lysine ligase
VSVDWQPTASRAALLARAGLLSRTRAFFAARGVLEVETPALVGAATSDPQIESLAVQSPAGAPLGFLHTSPEYAMKRLLAAGSGDIYQLCKVFRAGERSRLHNPEFTLLEWYRQGFSLPQLMQETAALAQALLAMDAAALRAIESIRYAEAFQRHLGIDPLTAPTAAILALAVRHGLVEDSGSAVTRDELLDFLVATQVGPALGQGTLCCLHHYPASQASLAQLDAEDPRTALRFELYADGVELANGYVELGDAAEQRARFLADAQARSRRGLHPHAGDARLLAALEAGLPPCAGVAMGFDRVVMLALSEPQIDAVLALPAERA